MLFQTPNLSPWLTSLPGLAAIFTLAYTILKDAKSRRLESYLKAVWGLSEKSPAARSACIFTLQSFVDSYTMFGRERQKRIIKVLATHLLTENDLYVRALCSQAIAASNRSLRSYALLCLYELNRTVWNEANIAVLQKNGQLEKKRRVLDGITDTIIRLLKQPGPYNLNLRGIHLDFSNLDGVDLRGCDLTEATLTNVALINPRLQDTIFDRAIIINSYLTDLDLGNTSLKGAVICDCRFESVTYSPKDVSGDARIFAGTFSDNDTKTSAEAAEERESQETPPELYLSRELDWTAIWSPSLHTEDALDAEWRSPYHTRSVTAELLKSQDGSHFIRQQSSDGNDGKYIVERKGWVVPDKIEYLRGSRTLKSDVKSWDAIRWILRSNATTFVELRRGITN